MAQVHKVRQPQLQSQPLAGLMETEEPTSSIVTSMAGYHGTLVAQAIQDIVRKRTILRPMQQVFLRCVKPVSFS